LPFKLALRTDHKLSPFKRYVREIITAAGPGGVDSGLLICNAYWKNVLPETTGKTDTLALIDLHCSGGFVKTLASRKGHPAHVTRFPDYVAFVANLTSRLTKVTVTGHIAPKTFWHAKVAMRIINGVPIAAVIGSSNMTHPAYSDLNRGFNHEADVLIWVNDQSLNMHFTQSDDADADESSFEVYGTENNGGDPNFPGFTPRPFKTVAEQLASLHKVIMDQVDDNDTV
jgi:hypothetical protein